MVFIEAYVHTVFWNLRCWQQKSIVVFLGTVFSSRQISVCHRTRQKPSVMHGLQAVQFMDAANRYVLMAIFSKSVTTFNNGIIEFPFTLHCHSLLQNHIRSQTIFPLQIDSMLSN